MGGLTATLMELDTVITIQVSLHLGMGNVKDKVVPVLN
jgi:hypothetical protein